jgi:CRISPR-associated protein (TIGR02710 family)
MQTTPNILLCTVGTGNAEKLRETLLTPLIKSIRSGEWKRIILLPSQETQQHARALFDELKELPIEVSPLPLAGHENSADDSFAHFDQVIGKLLAGATKPEEILVDYTRGTKVMSSALVLAAVRHELPVLRYLTSEKRDKLGMVVPGTEVVSEVRTAIVMAQKRFDEALMFFRQCNFAAATIVLEEAALTSGWPNALRNAAAAVCCLAQFYAAWDRLDYSTAVATASGPAFVDMADLPDRFRAFLPCAEVRTWVRRLAEKLPEDPKLKAAPLRCLLVDLFANGERRLRHHQYEDSLLRAYRVLELLGQVRLFDRGLDSAALDPNDPIIVEFQTSLAKKKSALLTSDRKDRLLQAPREKVGRLLKHLKDDFGQRLINAAEVGSVKAKSRNNSVLIHGFDAVAGSDPEPLRKLYGQLQSLICEDLGQEDSAAFLRSARLGGVV